MSAQYMVFLDIDGVLTGTRVHLSSGNREELWSQFDPVAVQFLNWIHDTVPDVHFMLISTWKEDLRLEGDMASQWVVSTLRNAGFRGTLSPTWKSNPDNLPRFKHRAWEIKDYLEGHPKVKDFIIFDDTDYAFEQVLGKRRWIRTDTNEGMLTKHMLKAKSIIGDWNTDE
jgi:hypothetical protein